MKNMNMNMNMNMNSLPTVSSPKHHSASEHGDYYAIPSSEARIIKAKHEIKIWEGGHSKSSYKKQLLKQLFSGLEPNYGQKKPVLNCDFVKQHIMDAAKINLHFFLLCT
jgi:hypothetical protein